MKKICILFLAVSWTISSYSQKVIQLEETELTFVPSAKILFEDYSSGRFMVKENYVKQFESNAIKFLNENFDIYGFMKASSEENLDQVVVILKSKNGFLKANYNKNGGLVNTIQKFKNVILPREVRDQVYSQYKDWQMTKNFYTASSKGSMIDSEKYVINVRKGNKNEKMKINPINRNTTSNIGVAITEK